MAFSQGQKLQPQNRMQWSSSLRFVYEFEYQDMIPIVLQQQRPPQTVKIYSHVFYIKVRYYEMN